MIRFRAYRAIDEPETCQKYLEGHINVLSVYGVTKITSANTDWFYNPASYVIIADYIPTGELVGGIRVHLVGGTQPLPVEEAIGEMDHNIYKMVKEYGVKGAGELCGLWNSKNFAGWGTSVFLTRAGVALCSQINAKTLFGICADFTLPMFKNVGYEVATNLGNNGRFYYPKEDFNANALIMEAVNLESANSFDRDIIMSLRNNPIQIREEAGPKGPVHIEYQLQLKQPAKPILS
ncbi:MAG: hypothetical protein ACK40G_08795 [Cytophagaceae bacterium]